MSDCPHLDYRCRPKGDKLVPFCIKQQRFMTHLRSLGCKTDAFSENVCKEENNEMRPMSQEGSEHDHN